MWGGRDWVESSKTCWGRGGRGSEGVGGKMQDGGRREEGRRGER